MEYVDGVPIMNIEELKRKKFDLQSVANTIAKAFCQMMFIDGKQNKYKKVLFTQILIKEIYLYKKIKMVNQE